MGFWWLWLLWCIFSMVLPFVLIKRCADGCHPGTGNEIHEWSPSYGWWMGEVPFLPFHLMKIWEKGSNAGVWSLMIWMLSVWIQPHSSSRKSGEPSFPSITKVWCLRFLPLDEFHIMFHCLINFWKQHFSILKNIILLSPGGRAIPAQEDMGILWELLAELSQ